MAATLSDSRAMRDFPELLTVPEIADILKLSKRHVSERLTQGDDFPKPYIIGSARRYSKIEVLEWLRNKR